MDVELFVTPGLGDNSYLVASGGEAALVDPQRDVGRFLAVARRRKLRVRWVLETHVHNDYVSGALEARAATGAELALPARGGYGFAHRPMGEGDEVSLGDLRLVAMETPGHTFEHLSWALHAPGDAGPRSVFTGGSLLVGSAGRTDLLGADHRDALSRLQFRALRRLAGLADAVEVLPTHGAGSFCTAASPAMERTSTIGRERERNAALRARDEEEFVSRQSALLAFPAYYPHIAPVNRRGPRRLADLPAPRRLSPQDLEAEARAGAWVLDARDRDAFARAHVPGSVNVELGTAFGTYAGWVLPFDAPLVLVLPRPLRASLEEARVQLLRIGFERVTGWLDGGVDAWRASGRPVRSYPTATVDDACRAYLERRDVRFLDVRQDREWESGHIPGSTHVFVGDLPGRVGALPPDGEWWTACASGMRASIAASFLDRAGLPVRVVSRGGVPEWLVHCYPGREGAAG